MGEPVDPVFSDREVFADYFTRYYTDYEPEHCMVAEDEGRVVGYLICCVDYARYRRRQAGIMLSAVPSVMRRILTGRYGPQNLRFLAWVLFRAPWQTPRTPKRAAHFHFNVLRPWRNGHAIRRLLFPFLEQLPRWGAETVFGQIQLYEDRRPVRLFERYGFHCYDRKEVTKFRNFGVQGVHVATFVRDLRDD
jgi:hypothetical protein